MSGLREKLKLNTPPVGKISFEEFLDWLDEDTYAEWVNGEVVMTSPASFKHQDINGFLYNIVRIYNDIFELGKVIFAPFQVKLTKNSREPDLIFISHSNLNNLQATFYLGAPDLIVEIVSPESQSRDRVDKFNEYEANGVKEYWLIDPTKNEAIFYQINSNGKFEVIPEDAEGRYYSKVLKGFWLDTDWLWRPVSPSINSIMFKINKEAYREYLKKLEDNNDL
jgi:Uma2 family endonuclease